MRALALVLLLLPTREQPALLKTFREEFVEIKAGKLGDVDVSAFELAKYEVPQNLWEAVTGANPSRWKGKRNSVEMLSFDEAVAFCKKATELLRGAKLIDADQVVRVPTEAEWEYAAGSTTRELAYPWGDLAAACTRAIIGRGRVMSEGANSIDESRACRVHDDGAALVRWGPVAHGADGDITAEGVRNMGGNVSEWVADTFASYTDLCWATHDGPLVDPKCTSTTRPSPAETFRSRRGGSWASVSVRAAAATRAGFPHDASGPNTGFRCAKSF